MLVNKLFLHLNDRLNGYLEESSQYLDFVRRCENNNNKTVLKPHINRSVVIHLYTIIESFTYDIVDGVLRALETIYTEGNKNYQDIDEKLKANHLKSSIKLLQVLNDNKRKDFKINVNDVINGLYKCITGNHTSFISNSFRIHSSNLNHENINQIFLNINIKSINNSSEASALIMKINNIVGYRNSLAHSFYCDDIIESLDLLIGYRDSINEYFKMWINLIIDQYCGIQKSILNQSLECYNMKKCFFNKKVIGFSIKNNKLHIGQNVFLITSDKKYINATIKSIGENGKNDYNSLDINESIDVALGFNEDIVADFNNIKKLIIFKDI